MSQIVFDDVTKTYEDGTEAVMDLNLEIDDGSLMVLVGPSGCGKTTALRMLAGLEGISDGEIRIGDTVVNELPPRERDIAMVFQNYALYPHLTVYDNMAYGLKIRKTPKDEIDKRVREAAAKLGLEEELDKKPKRLSGGQAQRVAMGRAIVREPQAFLMDEPLSNLDAALRVEMRTEVSRLQRDLGTTTMYVTHDQTEAMTLGDQVAVIRKGRLQQVGPPQELYEHPVNVFVAGFIGSPAMNLVEAELSLGGGGGTVRFGDASLALGERTIDDRPALRGFDGRTVILGIRPEDIDDDAMVDNASDDRTFEAEISERESMGSEVLGHFTVQAKPPVTDDTKELAEDAGAEAAKRLEEHANEGKVRFVARLNPRTRAREGARTRLAVDTRNLYFFDPDSGRAIEDGER
jgi:multiple sugar transport system ATP-binding protein